MPDINDIYCCKCGKFILTEQYVTEDGYYNAIKCVKGSYDDFIGAKMDENIVKMVQIKEIQLNPRFCSQEMFESLINQGVMVSWMDESELDKDDMVTIEIND